MNRQELSRIVRDAKRTVRLMDARTRRLAVDSGVLSDQYLQPTEATDIHTLTDAELRDRDIRTIRATCELLYEDTYPVSEWKVDQIIDWARHES